MPDATKPVWYGCVAQKQRIHDLAEGGGGLLLRAGNRSVWDGSVDRQIIGGSDVDILDVLNTSKDRVENGENPNAYTVRELIKKTGRGKEWVYSRLQELDDNGDLEHVSVERKTINGRKYKTTAYIKRVADDAQEG